MYDMKQNKLLYFNTLYFKKILVEIFILEQ
jgi:hypothetical protein